MLIELIRSGEIAEVEALQEMFLNHLLGAMHDDSASYERTTSALLEAVICAYIDRDECELEETGDWLTDKQAEEVMMRTFCKAYLRILRVKLDHDSVMENWPCSDIGMIYKPMPKKLARAIGVTLGVDSAKTTRAIQACYVEFHS